MWVNKKRLPLQNATFKEISDRIFQKWSRKYCIKSFFYELKTIQNLPMKFY